MRAVLRFILMMLFVLSSSASILVAAKKAPAAKTPEQKIVDHVVYNLFTGAFSAADKISQAKKNVSVEFKDIQYDGKNYNVTVKKTSQAERHEAWTQIEFTVFSKFNVSSVMIGSKIMDKNQYNTYKKKVKKGSSQAPAQQTTTAPAAATTTTTTTSTTATTATTAAAAVAAPVQPPPPATTTTTAEAPPKPPMATAPSAKVAQPPAAPQQQPPPPAPAAENWRQKLGSLSGAAYGWLKEYVQNKIDKARGYAAYFVADEDKYTTPKSEEALPAPAAPPATTTTGTTTTTTTTTAASSTAELAQLPFQQAAPQIKSIAGAKAVWSEKFFNKLVEYLKTIAGGQAVIDELYGVNGIKTNDELEGLRGDTEAYKVDLAQKTRLAYAIQECLFKTELLLLKNGNKAGSIRVGTRFLAGDQKTVLREVIRAIIGLTSQPSKTIDRNGAQVIIFKIQVQRDINEALKSVFTLDADKNFIQKLNDQHKFYTQNRYWIYVYINLKLDTWLAKPAEPAAETEAEDKARRIKAIKLKFLFEKFKDGELDALLERDLGEMFNDQDLEDFAGVPQAFSSVLPSGILPESLGATLFRRFNAIVDTAVKLAIKTAVDTKSTTNSFKFGPDTLVFDQGRSEWKLSQQGFSDDFISDSDLRKVLGMPASSVAARTPTTPPPAAAATGGGGGGEEAAVETMENPNEPVKYEKLEKNDDNKQKIVNALQRADNKENLKAFILLPMETPSTNLCGFTAQRINANEWTLIGNGLKNPVTIKYDTLIGIIGKIIALPAAHE